MVSTRGSASRQVGVRIGPGGGNDSLPMVGVHSASEKLDSGACVAEMYFRRGNLEFFSSIVLFVFGVSTFFGL